jgi:MoaA/NifB/PqqE/SkfB family radical SAM enzyme
MMIFKNVIKKKLPHKLILFRRSLIPLWRVFTKKNMRLKQQIPILHLHLTDHCNLNCRGCDNFSPLSPKVFAQIEIFEQDCARMAALSQGRIKEIQLLGGEPLLHPQIIDFMRIARQHFPKTPIKTVTNGILLSKQTEDFWQACRSYHIEIVVTKYPIHLDHETIARQVRQQNVVFSFYGNTDKIPKSMQCSPLDLSGTQNPHDSFLRCSSANRCISLDNGKIYTCSLIPYVKYFNTYFKQQLNVSSQDYMNIYQAENIDEILAFLAKPMPFCRYCNRKGTIWDIGYGISKQDISEWIGNK